MQDDASSSTPFCLQQLEQELAAVRKGVETFYANIKSDLDSSFLPANTFTQISFASARHKDASASDQHPIRITLPAAAPARLNLNPAAPPAPPTDNHARAVSSTTPDIIPAVAPRTSNEPDSSSPASPKASTKPQAAAVTPEQLRAKLQYPAVRSYQERKRQQQHGTPSRHLVPGSRQPIRSTYASKLNRLKAVSRAMRAAQAEQAQQASSQPDGAAVQQPRQARQQVPPPASQPPWRRINEPDQLPSKPEVMQKPAPPAQPTSYARRPVHRPMPAAAGAAAGPVQPDRPGPLQELLPVSQTGEVNMAGAKPRVGKPAAAGIKPQPPPTQAPTGRPMLKRLTGSAASAAPAAPLQQHAAPAPAAAAHTALDSGPPAAPQHPALPASRIMPLPAAADAAPAPLPDPSLWASASTHTPRTAAMMMQLDRISSARHELEQFKPAAEEHNSSVLLGPSAFEAAAPTESTGSSIGTTPPARPKTQAGQQRPPDSVERLVMSSLAEARAVLESGPRGVAPVQPQQAGEPAGGAAQAAELSQDSQPQQQEELEGAAQQQQQQQQVETLEAGQQEQEQVDSPALQQQQSSLGDRLLEPEGSSAPSASCTAYTDQGSGNLLDLDELKSVMEDLQVHLQELRGRCAALQ
jgi:hypothetical protein